MTLSKQIMETHSSPYQKLTKELLKEVFEELAKNNKENRNYPVITDITMLLHCSDELFKSLWESDVQVLTGVEGIKALNKRAKKLKLKPI